MSMINAIKPLSARQAMASAIGNYYDGYADPEATPENWHRALNAADKAIHALFVAGYSIQRGRHAD